MKKAAGLFLSIAMILSAFAGCGSAGNTNELIMDTGLDSGGIITAEDMTHEEDLEYLRQLLQALEEQEQKNWDDIFPEKTLPPIPVQPGGTITVWSFTNQLQEMLTQYKKDNPDFPYEFDFIEINDQSGAYELALDNALRAGGEYAPDIYAAEAAFAFKYTQGEKSNYAAAYRNLGIDVDNLIKAAQIAPYAYEVGTRNGEIVGLPFQATGGAFIYRRSIAIDTWGSDDPDFIASKIGPGWDKFMSAAGDLNQRGYSVVSGIGDVWQACRDNAEQPWIVNGRLTIAPDRLRFFDIAKQLYNDGYTNYSPQWQSPWFADMNDNGIRPVFGYFGPAWLINYVIADHADNAFGDWAICLPPTPFTWGGTWVIANKDIAPEKIPGVAAVLEWLTLDTSETGLQYLFANGMPYDSVYSYQKDTVSSAVVMAKSDGRLDVLGGQNMFDVFIPAGANAAGSHWGEFNMEINYLFMEQVQQYAEGQKTREQALADFKRQVGDDLGFSAD